MTAGFVFITSFSYTSESSTIVLSNIFTTTYRKYYISIETLGTGTGDSEFHTQLRNGGTNYTGTTYTSQYHGANNSDPIGLFSNRLSAASVWYSFGGQQAAQSFNHRRIWVFDPAHAVPTTARSDFGLENLTAASNTGIRINNYVETTSSARDGLSIDVYESGGAGAMPHTGVIRVYGVVE